MKIKQFAEHLGRGIYDGFYRNGKIRMEFKPARLIKTAGMFAVTEEAKGGVASPTMKNMVLAGN